MRTIIAALQVSLDGFIEGPNEELDWVDSWEDAFDIIGNVDAFIVGARTYPGYEQYWQAVLDNPRSILPFTGRPATEGEIAYAQFAGRTPHVVVSRTLQSVSWKHTRIVRGLEDVRRLKEEPGKDIHAVGGATLVSSLMNAGLVDEIRLVVQPIVLGGGTPLFKEVKERHALTLIEARPLQTGAVWLRYRCLADGGATAAEGQGKTMLAHSEVATRLPAKDLTRARRFYSEKLGLEPIEERPGGLRYRCGSGSFAVFESAGAASGTHTQMAWEVADIEATVAVLQRRGVVFEEYDLPGIETVNGIATIQGNYPSKGVGERGAWFRDSEGNLLGLGQPVR